MITLGWILVFGLPAAAFVAALMWPQRMPEDRTVKAIRERIEHEDKPDQSQEY